MIDLRGVHATRPKQPAVAAHRPTATVAPYSGLARVYDRVMGEAIFPVIRTSFDRAVVEFGIRFRCAADVGCGTGSFVRYLAGYGVPVYGVDSSPAMLRMAAKKNRSPSARLLRGNIQDLQLPHAVDLITCNYDTLNYFTSLRSLWKGITSLRGNLSVGGHLLFDLIVHTGLGKPASFVQKIRVPEGVAIWNGHVDPERGRSRVEMLSWYRTNEGELRAEREVHRQRWYPIELLCHLASAAGLTVRGVYDLYPWRPASSMSAWVKFITQRRR